MTLPDAQAGRVQRILVIKLGALGDVVLAMGPFAAIRNCHSDAHITLLTTPPFAALLNNSPWFDEIQAEDRAPLWKPVVWLGLRRWLRAGAFNRVYDLQTSDRSGWYFRLMGPGPRPEWSGIAPGCSHPHANPDRDFMHTIERQAEQLRMAGIDNVPDADLSWIDADTSRFGLSDRYALLVPAARRIARQSAGRPNATPNSPSSCGHRASSRSYSAVRRNAPSARPSPQNVLRSAT